MRSKATTSHSPPSSHQLRHRGTAEHDRGLRRTGRGAHRFTGARTNTTRGCAGRGGLQRWPERLGAWATQAAPRSSRQSGLVARRPIVTHTPTPPHIAFVRAPMDDSSHQTVPASRRKGARPLFRRVTSPNVAHEASSTAWRDRAMLEKFSLRQSRRPRHQVMAHTSSSLLSRCVALWASM